MHSVNHMFTYTPQSKTEQQQGKELTCSHRLWKLWTIPCPSTIDSSLQLCWTATTNKAFQHIPLTPTRLLAQKQDHTHKGKYYCHVVLKQESFSSHKDLTLDVRCRGDGQPSGTSFPFIIHLCCPAQQHSSSLAPLKLIGGLRSHRTGMQKHPSL